MPSRIAPRFWLLAALGVCSASQARASDWPTYMHDAQRTGVTAEGGLKTPLAQHWVWRSAAEPKPAWPPPQPGWTELPKVQFDDAFHAVGDADHVYFGSSVDNQIYALDAKTGVVRWRHFTGGPVRLAPTLANGLVFAGSDDGKVYALRRADGTPAWTFDAALTGRKVLGNGRVISLWPIRTSVLVEGERVFCGAGVFPYHHTSVFALEAGAGKLLWKSDAVSVTGGFSPQGYLLAAKDGLIVPSGRAPPVCLARDSGKLAYTFPAAGGKGEVGGAYGVISQDVLYVGTQSTLHGFRVAAGTPTPAGKWPTAEQLIVTDSSYLVLKGSPPPAYGRRPVTGKGDEITAYDRAAYDALPQKDAASIAKTKRWRYARPDLEAVIVALPYVIAGGAGEVIVLDAATGEERWVGAVDGKAVGLAVAHGRLLVSTTRGAIHCFAAGEAPAATVAVAPAAWPAQPTAAEVAAQAQDILEESGVRKGYALVTGPGAARLACELAKRTELTVTVIESDQQLTRSRERVADSGLYGRVTVEPGAADVLPYPDFAANLVVDLDATPSIVPAESLRVLKPCGGVLLTRGTVATVLRTSGNVSTAKGYSKLTRDVLTGSGWWTHQYADAGGSGSSGDQRVKGKLDVLWFGEPGADQFADRHERAVSPLVMNGLVFCHGWNFLDRATTVFCFDAYNGVRHWKRDLKGAVRLNVPAVSGNLACDAGSVFVASGPECHQLDALTGETKAVYQTPAGPDGTRRDWAYVAVADGRLVGSAASRPGFSSTVFAYDLAGGKLSWQSDRPEVRDTTLVVSGGRVLFVEKRPEDAKPADKPADNAADKPVKLDRKGVPIPPESNLRSVVCLDATSGQPLWDKQVDLTDCGRWENGVWGLLQALCKDDVLVLAGAYTIYGRRTDMTPRKAMALSAKDGSVLWTSVVENRSRPVAMHGALLAEPFFYDLQKGEKILKPQGAKLTPWVSGPRSGGCGPLSASDCMVFGRGGYTVWRDVETGPAASFVGMRPGCAINIIPAGGVVVQTEASSGCSCYQAVQCTVVFQPR